MRGIHIIFFAAFLATAVVKAEDCPDQVLAFDNFQLQQIWIEKTNTCYVLSGIFDPTGSGVERSYTFSSNGTFMVFNGYGNGSPSSDTGARVFRFFPRLNNRLEIFQDKDGKPVVRLPSGSDVTFDTRTGKIESFTNVTFVEDFAINRANKGGIEITHFNGLLLDFGFMMGNDPITVSTRKALFTSSGGNKCQVRNDDVIEYNPSDKNWDYPFRYDTDQKLKDFLDVKCPLPMM